MTAQPYVGITGFKRPGEIQATTDFFREAGFPGNFTAMYGIITSSKRISNPNREGNRSPAVKDIGALIKEVPSWALGMIHYCTSYNAGFADEVIDVLAQSGAKSVQLNIDWPNVKEVESVHEHALITYQLSDKDKMETLSEYNGLVDYCLIDLSRGAGIPFDINESREYLAAVQEALPNVTIGIAGGLNASNLYKVNQVGNNLMFDAEGHLLDRDGLNLDKVRDYVRAAEKLIEN